MTATAEPTTKAKEGRVVAIYGPVVDVEFPPDALPEINFAVEMDIELEGDKVTVTYTMTAKKVETKAASSGGKKAKK